MPCFRSTFESFCRLKYFQVITAKELENPELIRAIRMTGFMFLILHEVTPTGARSFFIEEYRKLEAANDNGSEVAKIINAAWVHTYLKTSVLSPPDYEIDSGKAKVWDERLRNWFRRTYFTVLPHGVIPYVSPDYTEIFLVTANIIGALTDESRKWPRDFGANDNNPLLPKPANDT